MKYNGLYYIYKYNQKLEIKIFKDDSVKDSLIKLIEQQTETIVFSRVKNIRKNPLIDVKMYFNKPITDDFIKQIESLNILKTSDFESFKNNIALMMLNIENAHNE